MRILNLKGSHYDVGLHHGRKLRELIRGYHNFCWMTLHDIPEDTVEKTLSKVEDGLRYGYWEALDEMKGIAEGCGLSYRDVLLMNFTSEVRSQMPSGCTSFAAIERATKTGQPIMGKTRDMTSQVYFPFQIGMKVQIPGKFKVFLAESFSGMVATGCGMNECGLVLALSIIRSINDADDTMGVQRAFLARLVLEKCRNVEDALDLFSRSDMAYQGANFMICDATGTCALVEKSHRHQAIIRPKDGSVASTNHFTDRKMLAFGKIGSQSSKARLERIVSLLESNHGKIDVLMAKRFLRNHDNGLNNTSICRHTSTRANTVQAYILEPSSRRVFIVDGHPCLNRFQQYRPFS